MLTTKPRKQQKKQKHVLVNLQEAGDTISFLLEAEKDPKDRSIRQIHEDIIQEMFKAKTFTLENFYTDDMSNKLSPVDIYLSRTIKFKKSGIKLEIKYEGQEYRFNIY